MSDESHLVSATDFLSDDQTVSADRDRQSEIHVLGDRIIAALKTVYDPEIPVDIFELGLIYKVDIDDDNRVHIDMTLTSPACPVAGILPDEVKAKVEAVEGVNGVELALVWDPPWHPSMMTEEAQLELGMLY